MVDMSSALDVENMLNDEYSDVWNVFDVLKMIHCQTYFHWPDLMSNSFLFLISTKEIISVNERDNFQINWPGLPGERGTLRKQSFKLKLWRMEFCQAGKRSL